MQNISHPPTGSWIRVRQSEQQVRFKLPGVTGGNLFMAAALVWMSFDLLRRSSILQAGRSSGSIILWIMALCFLAIAGLLIFGQPIGFYDSQNVNRQHQFQWLIAEIVVERQAVCLQFCTPFRRRWIYVPLSDVLSVEHRDEKYRLLLRHYRQRVCFIRTRDRTYAVGFQLRPFDQKWLATELANLLS